MQDLRLAVRALLATPIVTAGAVLSLALGIGANIAIFGSWRRLARSPAGCPRAVPGGLIQQRCSETAKRGRRAGGAVPDRLGQAQPACASARSSKCPLNGPSELLFPTHSRPAQRSMQPPAKPLTSKKAFSAAQLRS
jgi:hypothetical protein